MTEWHVLFFLDLGARPGVPFVPRLFCEVTEPQWARIEAVLVDPARQQQQQPLQLVGDSDGTAACNLSLSDVRFCVKERDDVYGYRRHRVFVTEELRQDLFDLYTHLFG